LIVLCVNQFINSSYLVIAIKKRKLEKYKERDTATARKVQYLVHLIKFHPELQEFSHIWNILSVAQATGNFQQFWVFQQII